MRCVSLDRHDLTRWQGCVTIFTSIFKLKPKVLHELAKTFEYYLIMEDVRVVWSDEIEILKKRVNDVCGVGGKLPLDHS